MTSRTIAPWIAGAIATLLVCGCSSSSSPHESPARIDHVASASGVTGTFSIVAVDPNTGTCGAAVASKYPSVGEVVPYVRAGVGAFCTQHWHNPPWGEQALDMLAAGKLPEEVLAELLRDDPQRDKRQLAIIDMSGRAANRNPADADPAGIWWGSAAGRFYACQGNTLTGRDVIVAMAQAYEETEGTLADRLIAALVAGDRAGGDHRGRLAAGIRVAKTGTPGYLLEIQVHKSDDAVNELARKYTTQTQNPPRHPREEPALDPDRGREPRNTRPPHALVLPNTQYQVIIEDRTPHIIPEQRRPVTTPPPCYGSDRPPNRWTRPTAPSFASSVP